MEQIKNFMITDWFRDRITHVDWLGSNHKVGVKLYTRAPNMSDRSYKNFKLITVLADLQDRPEWVEIRSSVVAKSDGATTDFYLEKDVVDGVDYYRLTQDAEPSDPTNTANIDDIEKSGWYIVPDADYSQEIIVCAVFYIDDTWYIGAEEFVNPVIAASTQGIGNLTVVHNGTIFGQTTTNADSNEHIFKYFPTAFKTVEGLTVTLAVADGYARYLFFDSDPTSKGLQIGDFISVSGIDTTGHEFYDIEAARIVTINEIGLTYLAGSNESDSVYDLAVIDAIAKSQSYDFYAGNIYMKPAPPIWENAHAQHIWIEPQRINYIANPSFEGGTFGWRCSDNASISSVTGGLNSIPARQNCLEVTRSGTGRVVLESNFFPRDSQWLSVSFNIKGEGTVRFGIINFDPSYYGGVYLRSEDQDITDAGFYRFTALVPYTDFAVESIFRIEVDADEFQVDDVLVDPHEVQYDYFDGDSIEGLAGDFRWANNENNQQFSVWYNNYSNTSTRLIGYWDYADTEENPNGVYKPGLVDEWIPTGANVIVHWDAVNAFTPRNWLGNAYYQISDVNGTSVTDLATFDELDFNLNPY